MDDCTSPFRHAAPYAGDPILTLNAACMADPRPDTINLSIGVYTDADGRIPVLPSVQAAMRDRRDTPRPYLPMEGDAGFCRGLERLVFGNDHAALGDGRVASIQTIGCTGALAIAADLLHGLAHDRPVLISRPGWDNHHDLFRRAGFTTFDYPWCDPAGLTLAWRGMAQPFEAAPRGSVIVMQAAGHNPTGLDMPKEIQAQFIDLVRDRGHVVVFDLSYQGLARGMDADAAFIRRFAATMPCLVATSFSKNTSLYGERVGGLSAVCGDTGERDRMLGQMRRAVRRSYSSPPITGAHIVAQLLNDPDLRAQWYGEVEDMRLRMAANRAALADRLEARGVAANGIRHQVGMFAWTGLSQAAVHRLRDEHAIYLLDSGRLCVAGLTPGNLYRVAHAIAGVTTAADAATGATA